MTEDAAIRIDLNSAERVHLYPTPDGARSAANRPTHPTVRTLGSYGPILHPALKAIPPPHAQKELHRNCEMPPCGHTGVALRGWSHSHLSPTDPLIPSILLTGMVPHLLSSTRPLPHSRRCGVYEKSREAVGPLGFRPGRAHVLQTSVKPQHRCFENRTSGNALRSAPSSPIPDRLFRAHPRQSTQNAFSYRFTPLTPRITIPIPTHASRSSAYIHAYI
jgi:hypothetical protein